MENTKLLQILVILEWIILIAAVTLSTLFLQDRMPLELKLWIDADLESDLTTSGIMSLVLLVANFVGSVGLYNLKKWGAWIYLGSLILIFPLATFTGPIVSHGIESAMYDISVIITGMIIALAFFTDTLNGNKKSNS
jgi:hypothetical protein